MENTIRVERAKKGISQKQLAEEVGVTTPAINLIENNKVDTNLSTAMKIAKYFGLKVQELFNL